MLQTDQYVRNFHDNHSCCPYTIVDVGIYDLLLIYTIYNSPIHPYRVHLNCAAPTIPLTKRPLEQICWDIAEFVVRHTNWYQYRIHPRQYPH